MNKKKMILWIIGAAIMAVIVVIVVCNTIIICNASGRTFDKAEQVPHTYQTGLLLGTTPQTRIGNRVNQFFTNRIAAAAELYKAGKIRRLFVSGSGKSLEGVNEPKCMRDALIKCGVPDSIITLDEQGNRTINSIENLKQNGRETSFIIISQRFHNERAIFQADYTKGAVTDVIGFNAKEPTQKTAILIYIREWFAKVKVFIDLWL